MRTFDQSLVEMCLAGEIAEAVALAEADVSGEVRLALRQGQLGAAGQGSLSAMDTSRLSLSDGG